MYKSASNHEMDLISYEENSIQPEHIRTTGTLEKEKHVGMRVINTWTGKVKFQKSAVPSSV